MLLLYSSLLQKIKVEYSVGVNLNQYILLVCVNVLSNKLVSNVIKELLMRINNIHLVIFYCIRILCTDFTIILYRFNPAKINCNLIL